MTSPDLRGTLPRRTVLGAALLFVMLFQAFSSAAAQGLPDGQLGTEVGAVAMAPPAPTDPANLIASADQALQGGRLIEAEALLDRIGTLDPQLVPDPVGDMAALLRAELMLATGHPSDALKELQSRPVGNVSKCRAAAAEGLALISLDRFSEASATLQSEAHECDSDPVYWRTLGRLKLVQGRPVEAVAALRSALDRSPGNRSLRNDLGVALLAADLPGEAIDLFTELVRDDPEQAEVLVNLDYARAMLGRTPVRRSADSDVFWSRRLQFAGAGARQAGRNGLAEALLSQAVIERPHFDPQLWRQYSELTGK